MDNSDNELAKGTEDTGLPLWYVATDADGNSYIIMEDGVVAPNLTLSLDGNNLIEDSFPSGEYNVNIGENGNITITKPDGSTVEIVEIKHGSITASDKDPMIIKKDGETIICNKDGSALDISDLGHPTSPVYDGFDEPKFYNLVGGGHRAVNEGEWQNMNDLTRNNYDVVIDGSIAVPDINLSASFAGVVSGETTTSTNTLEQSHNPVPTEGEVKVDIPGLG